MKILLVPELYLPVVGGIEVNTHGLAKALAKKGHEVVVLTSNFGLRSLPYHEKIDGIETFRLPFYVFKGSIKSLLAFLVCFPIALLGTCALIWKFNPDVINIHFPGNNALYILLADFVKPAPLVVSLHGNEVINIPDKPQVGSKEHMRMKWMKRIIRGLLQRADHVTAVADFLLEGAIDLDNQIGSKYTRIFMGGFAPHQISNSSISFHNPFILAVGRLGKQKWFDLLIEAFKPLSEIHKQVSLLIIGDGPDRELLTEKIRDYNVQDRVILKGALPKDEIMPYYAGCLFVGLSSRWEGLPTVIWEAFSLGKPVIAPAIDGIPEVVFDKVNGLLFEKGNLPQLTSAMEKLLTDEPLRTKLGAGAKSFMDDIGGYDKCAERYLKVYRQVLMAKGNN
jgi:glycosyltransferase involved in cell wall biosynthesis